MSTQPWSVNKGFVFQVSLVYLFVRSDPSVYCPGLLTTSVSAVHYFCEVYEADLASWQVGRLTGGTGW